MGHSIASLLDRPPALTIVSGHFGVGKTNLALNLAYRWSGYGRLRLIDLDIVNPYFRTADAAQSLQEAGIALISSQFANSNMEAPALPPEKRHSARYMARRNFDAGFFFCPGLIDFTFCRLSV